MATRITLLLLILATCSWAQIHIGPPFIGPPISIGPQLGYRVLTIPDITGDGIPDYVAASPTYDGGPLVASSSGRITAFSGANGATLWHTNGTGIGDNYGLALGLADVNGDGIDEVVTVRQFHVGVGAAPVIEIVDILSGAVTSSLTVPATVPWAQVGTTIDAYDLDGDGKDEILVGIGGSLDSQPNSATHPPGALVIFPSNNGPALTLTDINADDFGRSATFAGDVNFDGTQDILVTAPYAPNVTAGGTIARAGLVRIVSGADLSTLLEYRGTMTNEYLGFSALALGDINIDGIEDFAVTRKSSLTGWSLDVYYGLINVIGSHDLAADMTPSQRIKFCEDVDTDGRPDIAIGGTFNQNGVGLVDFLSTSDFRRIDRYEGSPLNYTLFANDFDTIPDTDGDGRPELLVGEPAATQFIGQVTRLTLKPCLSALGDGSLKHDLLVVDGNAALPSRRVDLSVGQPFTIGVEADLTTGQPTDHIIWGLIGVPGQASVFNVTGGSFLFPPRIAAPSLPWLFTLTDSIGYDPAAAFPGYQAPWSIGAPFGIAMPIDLTFQGVTISGGNIDITNGIILSVR